MREEQVITVRKIVEGPAFQDSIEIGTPGKGGAIKIYGDFGSPDDFQRRIAEAVWLRNVATDLMEGSP